jgi:hypothetical protein
LVYKSSIVFSEENFDNSEFSHEGLSKSSENLLDHLSFLSYQKSFLPQQIYKYNNPIRQVGALKHKLIATQNKLKPAAEEPHA